MLRAPALLRQVGAVGIGLVVLGLASFAYLALSGRDLGPEAFAPLGTLWVVLNAAGPALFQPLEQEMGRSVASAHALGRGDRTTFLRGATIGAVVMGTAAVVVLALARPVADAVFGGRTELVVALVIGMAALGAEHLTRGAFAGSQAFGRYGWQLGLDGVARLAAAAALFLAGVGTVGLYAAVLAGAPVLAVLLTARRLGPAMMPGPPSQSWGHLWRAVGALMVGATLAQFVVNAAPVTANFLAEPDEAARAGVFISVLVLARIPLFLFSAIQAAFLPGLAALAAVGDRAGFTRRLKLVLAIVSALGLGGLAVFVAIGPWLVTTFYGPAFTTTRVDLWPLAAGAGAFMVAATLAQTLVSMRAYVDSVLGWVLGSVTFLAVVAIPLRLEQRVGLAFLAATVVAAATGGLLLLRRLRGTWSPMAEVVPATRSSD